MDRPPGHRDRVLAGNRRIHVLSAWAPTARRSCRSSTWGLRSEILGTTHGVVAFLHSEEWVLLCMTPSRDARPHRPLVCIFSVVCPKRPGRHRAIHIDGRHYRSSSSAAKPDADQKSAAIWSSPPACHALGYASREMFSPPGSRRRRWEKAITRGPRKRRNPRRLRLRRRSR